jgi:protein involved in polysaccharide export with SLBB domain
MYPITRDHTRLSEVIRAAGGFTDVAELKSAEVIRQSFDPAEMQLERLQSERGGIASEDSLYYFLETNLRIQKELVGADFDALFRHGDSTQDVILQDGDKITVPSIRKTIYVFGQVVSIGHQTYVPGESAEYYIRKAGGFTEQARQGDVKIVKAKTRQWLSPNETTVEEGDYVWVPKEPTYPFAYYMTVFSQAASVLSVVIGIAVVITQLKK